MRSSRLVSRRAPSAVGGILLSVVLTACSSGRSVDERIVYDFVSEFTVAEPLVESGRLEFGKPAARALMIDGWHSQDERWDRETPFVWGTGLHCRFNRSVQQCPRVYPPVSDSRVSCGVECSGVAQSHRDTAVARQVRTPGEVLQAVGVLVRAALPRTPRVAEVHLHARRDRERA